ncbi:hypothetical protein ACT01S_28880, partial [Klebsiella pneumoniae]|uniref:hypothetical protein n=1 Tax=Klebsiella pneumoniae TaxID=573 RepID=UPI00402BDFCE
YSAIDQIAQFGLSSLKVIYYSEQLFSLTSTTYTKKMIKLKLLIHRKVWCVPSGHLSRCMAAPCA